MNVSSMRRVLVPAVCAVSVGLWGEVTVVDINDETDLIEKLRKVALRNFMKSKMEGAGMR